MKIHNLIPVILLLVFFGCNSGGSNSSDTQLTQDVRTEASNSGLTGDPSLFRDLPSIDDPLPQLGKKLFFSKILGGQLDSACASCHHPSLGGTDHLSLPIGIEAESPDLVGPGRRHDPSSPTYDGGPTVPRNSPTVFNIGMWDSVLFFDGRVESLSKTEYGNGVSDAIRTPDTDFGEADEAAINLPQAQALFPVTSDEEMAGDFHQNESREAIRNALASRIIDQEISNTWLDEFRKAYDDPLGEAGDLITYESISMALGEYERSMVFVNTPWKAFLEGEDTAISRDAKKGALLFLRPVSQGGAGCAACHSGDFFTDEAFHVLAIPQIGRGKEDGDNGTEDYGRYRESSDPDDLYAFRTPSLLNIEITPPYGHDGAYQTLEGIVRHHLDPATAVAGYDFTGSELQEGIQTDNAETNTQAALAQLEKQMAEGKSMLQTVTLTDDEVEDLLAFLNSLTDPCTRDRDCLAPWIPDTEDNGPDGLQLNAVNQDWELL